MSEMSKEEFLRQKADAEERIRQIYRGRDMSFPDFVSLPQNTVPKKSDFGSERENKQADTPAKNKPQQTAPTSNKPLQFMRYLNLPELLKSPDTLLILGLIFLLMSDNADEMLILALIFIML